MGVQPKSWGIGNVGFRGNRLHRGFDYGLPPIGGAGGLSAEEEALVLTLALR
jgi:hypothetical protein